MEAIDTPRTKPAALSCASEAVRETATAEAIEAGLKNRAVAFSQEPCIAANTNEGYHP